MYDLVSMCVLRKWEKFLNIFSVFSIHLFSILNNLYIQYLGRAPATAMRPITADPDGFFWGFFDPLGGFLIPLIHLKFSWSMHSRLFWWIRSSLNEFEVLLKVSLFPWLHFRFPWLIPCSLDWILASIDGLLIHLTQYLGLHVPLIDSSFH